ncbi:MAG: helix-turn-helix domain-containing protein [Phenylobacterium sp.]|uniref:helix-turn-helix domain-containing protein n=1 Tax=Phenylobacterium sp. TaxID=1871053 RepID=UPI001A41671E|nr:helix-turn-helix domain-containing protein [Phenylobacterium sp.]MBL8772610.1 helix-turn-helix domain-containing protein [Phenylobacterium sp.]
MSGGVPYLTFQSAEVPRGEGRRRWEDLIGAYDVRLPPGLAEDDFSVRSETWLVAQLIVSHGRLSPVRLNRSSERVAADGRDTFTIGLVTHGLLAGDFDGRACELRPGQVCMIDFARPWQAQTEETEFVLLSVPRPALMALAPRTLDLHGRRLEGAAARILTEHLLALVRYLPQVEAADAPLLQRTTLRLLADGLEALAPIEAAGAGPLESRLTYRVRRHIEENLAAPDLTPAGICRALGVTRPTLYRAFRPLGGIMNYVRRRRLEAVHVRLSDPSEPRGVAELAEAFGFSSHAHFSTAFRRRFGYAPRDARIGAHGDAGATLALKFRSWMLGLPLRDDAP